MAIYCRFDGTEHTEGWKPDHPTTFDWIIKNAWASVKLGQIAKTGWFSGTEESCGSNSVRLKRLVPV